MARLRVAFVPHGGGPWPFVNLGLPENELQGLSDYLRELRTLPRTDVRAVLVISAHWEESAPTLLSAPEPELYYDYYGFPDETYNLKWGAKNAPEVLQEVESALQAAGVPVARDPERGYDHGTFVPLMLTWPRGELSILQLSLRDDLDPEFHIKLGKALAPLRDQGIFIVGTGMTFHNMRAFRQPDGKEVARAFHDWLAAAVRAPAEERDQAFANWASAPGARFSHPREEHLVPLFVIAGAAGEDLGKVDYDGTYMGWPLLGAHFG